VSELRLIHGIDGDVYTALAPYVSALPEGTTINVNTASVPVLMTLASYVTAEMAQTIWQHGRAHFHSLADLTGVQPALRVIVCHACYSWHSAYFEARGQITLDGLPFEFRSLIERRTGGSDGGVRVLQRSRGPD